MRGREGERVSGREGERARAEAREARETFIAAPTSFLYRQDGDLFFLSPYTFHGFLGHRCCGQRIVVFETEVGCLPDSDVSMLIRI